MTYSNPSTGEFVNLTLSDVSKGQLHVRVLDAAGRAVASRVYAVEELFSTVLVFDEELGAGVYMIEMLNEGSHRMERLIFQ